MKPSLSSFPTLTIPFAIYNVVAAFTSFAPDIFGSAFEAMRHTVLIIPMASPGVQLQLSLGDLVLLVGVLSLFVELVVSTSSSDEALVGDALTLVLSVACLMEFLLLPPFATGTFFLLMVMILMDAIAGFIVSAVSARKDIGMGG